MKLTELEVYLINLDRSQKRLEISKAQLNKYDINFQRFSACDGQKIKQDDILAAQKKSRWSLLLSPSEIGCYRSHKMVCQEFLTHSEKEWAWILEDDFELQCDNIQDILENLLLSWPQDVDFVKFARNAHDIGEKLVNLKIKMVQFIILLFRIK